MNYVQLSVWIIITLPVCASKVPLAVETDVKSEAVAGVPVAMPAPAAPARTAVRDIDRQVAKLSEQYHQLKKMKRDLYATIESFAQESDCPNIDDLLVRAVEPVKKQITEKHKILEERVTQMLVHRQNLFDAYCNSVRKFFPKWPYHENELRRWTHAGFEYDPTMNLRDRVGCKACGQKVASIMNYMDPADYHDYSKPHDNTQKPGTPTYSPLTPQQLKALQGQALLTEDQIINCSTLADYITHGGNRMYYVLRRVNLRANQLVEMWKKPSELAAHRSHRSKVIREQVHETASLPRELVPIVAEYVPDEFDKLIECAFGWVELHKMIGMLNGWLLLGEYLQNPTEWIYKYYPEKVPARKPLTK